MTHDVLRLLHVCDSLFPIGSFSHSDGLESATATGAIENAADLGPWMDAGLQRVLATAEGPGVARAWLAFHAREDRTLMDLDAELHAIRPAAASRDASRSMGTRLLRTWGRAYPGVDLRGLLSMQSAFTLPVAFGVVSAASGIGQRSALEGFLYTRLSSTISAAMRLIPIGQHEAHALLATSLGDVPPIADAILSSVDPIQSFAPALDLASMRHQYVTSRLFRS